MQCRNKATLDHSQSFTTALWSHQTNLSIPHNRVPTSITIPTALAALWELRDGCGEWLAAQWAELLTELHVELKPWTWLAPSERRRWRAGGRAEGRAVVVWGRVGIAKTQLMLRDATGTL